LTENSGVIDIYIGISHRFDIIKGMTERSILRNTSAKVNITHLYPDNEQGATGFSSVRYGIRKGIYIEVDMIVLGDIAELWEYHQTGKFVCMHDGKTDVAVIDCVHACHNKREQHLLPKLPIIPPQWNVIPITEDSVIPDDTKLLHFSCMDSQPWFYEHPNKRALEIYEEYA